jgi:hypothetical protein
MPEMSTASATSASASYPQRHPHARRQLARALVTLATDQALAYPTDSTEVGGD